MIRKIHLILGLFFFAIGVIGLFLPLLPTTPFLLLASYFFSRGYPPLHAYLLNHHLFGLPIRDWEMRGAIRTKYKCLATAMIIASLVYILSKENIPLAGKIASAILISTGLIYIWSRPSA
jgi:uncharacterized membrane protein YbaN (DUF454 family)